MANHAKLFTQVNCPAAAFSVSFSDSVCGIGSCFAKDVLDILFSAGIKGMGNPSGIIYNAVSIANILEQVAGKYVFSEKDFFEYGGLYHSWEHHGDFSCPELQNSVDAANKASSNFYDELKKASLLLLTPASSVVYEYVKSGRIVAHCHKVPGNEFKKRILSVSDNLDALKRAVQAALSVNPSLRIILTLSPVRHYPGDLVLNARSKANLLSAIHELEPENVFYFPSYEIVLDELRDYRFFEQDMLHPSGTAREIVFERFVETYFDASAQEKIKAGLKESRRNAHIPMKDRKKN